MTAQGPELEGSPTNPHQTAAKVSPSKGGREEVTKPSAPEFNADCAAREGQHKQGRRETKTPHRITVR